MEIRIHEINNEKVAEIISDEIIIREPQEALDIMAEIGYRGAEKIVLNENHLTPQFFDLKSGIAGEVLQKFSNYNFKLAIIGDFSKFKSKSLQDLIRECNKGNRIYFIDNLEAALIRLTGK